MRNYRQNNREPSKAIWSQSIIHVEKGFCRGPFHHENEVSEVVGSRHWIAMPRFPVQQATKVRRVPPAGRLPMPSLA